MESRSPIFDDCLHRIYKHGEQFRKQHGTWYRLHIFGNYWLTLDSWNNGIVIFSEKPEPAGGERGGPIWVFRGKSLYALTLDFGGVKEHPMLNYWRLHLPVA